VARVKICPNCRHENAFRVPFCEQCGVDLSSVEALELSKKSVETPGQGEAVPPAEGAAGSAPEDPGGARTFLTFPWGDEEVADLLFIGRDPDLSPLAERMERDGFGWVSRRHAELYVEGGTLFVRDLGSANGTFVNGRQLETAPVALGSGDQVAFSKRLIAIVRKD
jgi:hypothetical protein